MAVFHSLLPVRAMAFRRPQPSSSAPSTFRISFERRTGRETNTHPAGPVYFQGFAMNTYLILFGFKFLLALPDHHQHAHDHDPFKQVSEADILVFRMLVIIVIGNRYRNGFGTKVFFK